MKRALAGALGLALWAAGAAGSPAILTADQMRTFGLAALTKGYADQAVGIAEALLQRDAADSAAWVLKAQALRLRGDLPGSEAAARQAWATARDKPARYVAATALAQALSLQDHRTRAQYWLRQAVQNAPNGAAQSQALQDYAYVRDQNPISLQFSGSVRPSNNVNDGGKVQFIQIGPFILPLPSTLLALSGTGWALGADGQYRLSDDGRVVNALTFGAHMQGVVLSSKAMDLAPDLSNGDFLYRQVQVGWQRRATLAFGRLTSGVSAAHSWYGDSDLANSLTGRLALNRPLGPDLALNLGADVTRQVPVSGHDGSTSYGIEASLKRSLAQGDTVEVRLDLTRVVSANAGTDRKGAEITLQWQSGQAVMGLGFGANLSAHYALYGNARQDSGYAAGLTATVNRITYLGFSPVVSFDVAHNGSTVPWFTSDTVAVGLSLKSRF